MKFKRIISRVFRGIINLPKTIYLNLFILPLEQGIKFPIVVMSSVSAEGLKRGSLIIDGPIEAGMIRLGALKTGKRGLNVNKKTTIITEKGGYILFRGAASIGRGTALCANAGSIVIGDKFSCNVNCFIYSQKKIVFGEDVLLGWEISVRDNDGHPIYDHNRNVINEPKEIYFDDHIWVGSYADILKGVNLSSGTIVATRSLVTKSFNEKNSVIAGIPAKIVKSNVFWEHNTEE